MTSLPDYLIEQSAPDNDPTDAPDEVREVWQIDGDGTANWALRKLARAQQEVNRINAAADAEIARVNEWRASALRTPARSVEFFEDKLTIWHQTNLYHAAKEAGVEWSDKGFTEWWPKFKGKTRQLPAGSVGAKKDPDAIEIVDPDAFTEWAIDAERYDLINITPAKADLKRLPATDAGEIITHDGEKVPGVQRKPGAISFTAKPTADEQPAWLPMQGDDE